MQSATAPFRPRRAAYSVVETARMCGLSRARFYDLLRNGVMPHPVYCVRTRRPMYTADLAAICQRVRETGTGIDGRYVLFYTRQQPTSDAASSQRPRVVAVRATIDPLTQEMISTLQSMGVRTTEQEMTEAIRRRCPEGVQEEGFETDLRAVFDHLRRRNGA